MKKSGVNKRRSPLSSYDLRRRGPVREPNKRILIVCEGSKTEPGYFRDAIDDMRLSTAHVVVDDSEGSSPVTVVKRAKRRYNEDKRTGDPFDIVFCVFDRDEHAGFNDAIESIRTAIPTKTFKAIVSIPCFEYWVLLHFEYTTNPFPRTGKKTSCECVITQIKNYMPDYEKAQTGLFVHLKSRLADAKIHAKKANIHCESSKSDGPKTDVFRIFETFDEISK